MIEESQAKELMPYSNQYDPFVATYVEEGSTEQVKFHMYAESLEMARNIIEYLAPEGAKIISVVAEGDWV